MLLIEPKVSTTEDHDDTSCFGKRVVSVSQKVLIYVLKMYCPVSQIRQLPGLGVYNYEVWFANDKLSLGCTLTALMI